MRVAVVGPSSPRELLGDESAPVGLGGSPINALVSALVGIGHEVVLITASPDIASNWVGFAKGLTVHCVPYRRSARVRALDLFRSERAQMRAALDSEKVDVVHAHWSYEFGWVGVTSGRPNLLSVHDAPLTILRSMPNPYRLARTVMAYFVRSRAHQVSAVSPYLSKAWRAQMLFRSDPIEVIPNITPELADRVVTNSPHPSIVDVADSSARKNIRTLLKAFALVRREFPEARLRLIGPGLNETGPLADWARKRGLSAQVEFLGLLSRLELSRRLDEATVFAHTAVEESQPMCLLEAMAKEVPILGGIRAGGVPWTLGDGRAGVLVDVEKPQNVADGIMELIRDDTKRELFKRQGLALLSERHSPKAVAMAYLVLYERAIARQSLEH